VYFFKLKKQKLSISDTLIFQLITSTFLYTIYMCSINQQEEREKEKRTGRGEGNQLSSMPVAWFSFLPKLPFLLYRVSSCLQ
jgi:hypothetical protein